MRKPAGPWGAGRGRIQGADHLWLGYLVMGSRGLGMVSLELEGVQL